MLGISRTTSPISSVAVPSGATWALVVSAAVRASEATRAACAALPGDLGDRRRHLLVAGRDRLPSLTVRVAPAAVPDLSETWAASPLRRPGRVGEPVDGRPHLGGRAGDRADGHGHLLDEAVERGGKLTRLVVAPYGHALGQIAFAVGDLGHPAAPPTDRPHHRPGEQQRDQGRPPAPRREPDR
jgi:hypothetical protein